MFPNAAQPRFEFKYRVDECLAAELEHVVQFHLEADRHSRDGDYVVNSLYFDTPRDRDASETDEGIVLRSKVRLRCYSSDPMGPYFLELKQRYGSSIYKTRALLGDDDAHRLVSGSVPQDAYRDHASDKCLDIIREVIDRREMTPRVWVKYRRRAWSSPWGDGARMTMDRNLENQAFDPSGPLAPMDWRWTFPELDERRMLELKFLGSAPSWMLKLAQDHQLERVSCSKYGVCLQSIQGPTAFARLAEAS